MAPQHLVTGEKPLRRIGAYSFGEPRSGTAFKETELMKFHQNTIAEFRERFGGQWAAPEYRQIELYTKKKQLAFSDEEASAGAASHPPNPLSTLVAFSLLENVLEARDLSLEGKPLWQKYLGLPKKSVTDKLVAEVFRILRIYRTVVLHRDGQMEIHNGSVKLNCTHNRCALSLWISPVGLRLIESFVFYYLDSFRQPYSEAYVEAMLTQYFLDIVAETKKFADEDRVLYQFRRKYDLNRHFRFDCDNPKFSFDGDQIVFEIGERYQDKSRFPIDFFVMIRDVLHIIPVEALTRGALPQADLELWIARTPGDHALPAEFRTRFGRETMIVGLPMT